jgi:hypothetical protein
MAPSRRYAAGPIRIRYNSCLRRPSREAGLEHLRQRRSLDGHADRADRASCSFATHAVRSAATACCSTAILIPNPLGARPPRDARDALAPTQPTSRPQQALNPLSRVRRCGRCSASRRCSAARCRSAPPLSVCLSPVFLRPHGRLALNSACNPAGAPSPTALGSSTRSLAGRLPSRLRTRNRGPAAAAPKSA